MGVQRELGNVANANIYRIIQELVNNAIKYANPTSIMVQLTKTDDRVLITVEDNGIGLDMQKLEQTKGIGIANIKHRVKYLNGILDINGKQGEGTSFNIELSI